MTKLALLAPLLVIAGCMGDRQHRQNSALLAANVYAAAQAASTGADLQKTTTAIRLLAEKIAQEHGFEIDGAEAWIKSLASAPVPAPATTPGAKP